MSEVMAIESMAAEYAKFRGYLTETRVPFKLRKGISDLDVLGYNPKTKTTLVIECKAWGSPNQYKSFNSKKRKELIRKQFREIVSKWGIFKDSRTNKWKLKRLNDIWLIIPGYCDDNNIEGEISKELYIRARIIPIHRLIIEIIRGVKEDKVIRRKRYSNPALELCR